MPYPALPTFGLQINPVIETPFSFNSSGNDEFPPVPQNAFLLMTGAIFLLMTGGDFLLME